MAKVLAVCISPNKGTSKIPIQYGIFIESYGIQGDAHADNGHRQVSLLAVESINKMNVKGLGYGLFAENITTEGLVLYELPIGTRLRIGEVLLEVSQIGKECHQGCKVREKTGDCVMPREGIFAIVLKGGIVRAGDKIVVETNKIK